MEVVVKEEKRSPSVSHRYITPFWEVNIPDKFSEDLKQKIEKMVDNRKDWPTFLYETFIPRMIYEKIKDKSLNLKELQYEESLLAIVDRWKKEIKLREVSNQKSLSEIDPSLGKVTAKKPVKGPGKPLKAKKK